MKKYDFTEEILVVGDKNMRRIRALVDIPRHGVTVGDLGGWIGSEKKLSHDGACWVGDEAVVCGDAVVGG